MVNSVGVRAGDTVLSVTGVEGVFVIKDQYGDRHHVEQNVGDDFWSVITSGI